jgi:hypothetical protein
VLDRVWERLGIGAAIRRVADRRRLDGEAAERVLFALVAHRALEPGSKLAGAPRDGTDTTPETSRRGYSLSSSTDSVEARLPMFHARAADRALMPPPCRTPPGQ